MTIRVVQSNHIDVGTMKRPGVEDIDPHLVVIDERYYAKIWRLEPNTPGESFWCIKVVGDQLVDDWLDIDYTPDWSDYLGLQEDPLEQTLQKIERVCRDKNLI